MKERLTWLRIPSQAGGMIMRQFRWIPQLFATLCANNQFAFSHNRKASFNGSPSFSTGEYISILITFTISWFLAIDRVFIFFASFNRLEFRLFLISKFGSVKLLCVSLYLSATVGLSIAISVKSSIVKSSIAKVPLITYQKCNCKKCNCQKCLRLPIVIGAV